MSFLEQSILCTIIYYNNLGQPLTDFEIYKYLIRPKAGSSLGAIAHAGFDFVQVRDCLEQSNWLRDRLETKNGFYFLRGKAGLAKQRITKYRIAIKKWKKAKRVAKWLQVIPFVRMVAVSGSLAINNTRKKSDIDLLVATEYRRIWLTRMLVTLFIHLMGARRYKKLTANRFCLNHYITDQSLFISFKSLYNAQTYAHLTLLYQSPRNNIFPRFQKSNAWLKDYLFHFNEQKVHLHTIKNNRLLAKIADLFEAVLKTKIGEILENLCRSYQRFRIQKDPLTNKEGGRVTFTDYQLEFHPESPELKILNSFNVATFKMGLLEYTNQKNSGLKTCD